MARYRLSKDAETDLLGIWEYIATDDERAAEAFHALLHEKFRALAFSPLIGIAANDVARGLRKFPVGNYLIYYRPIRGKLTILRVIHGKRRQQRAFRK